MGMPSRAHHRQRGANIGLEEYLAWKRQSGEEPDLVGIGFSMLLGSVAANLADDLEPPTGPKHRGYLHSWEALLLANQQYALRSDVASRIFFRAYGSHLKDDSKTTASLPLATLKLLRALRRRF